MQHHVYARIPKALGHTAKPVALKPFLIFLYNIFRQAETALFHRKCQNPIADFPIQMQGNELVLAESRFLMCISGQHRICERNACI